MSEQLAKNFIEALRKLESDNDLETMVGLFAETCSVGNVVSPHEFQGIEGAREFWTNYRKTFGEINSTFRNEIIIDNRAGLEWKSEGTSGTGGERINYQGVSILEMENNKITRFYAYFDAGKLGRQITDNE